MQYMRKEYVRSSPISIINAIYEEIVKSLFGIDEMTLKRV